MNINTEKLILSQGLDSNKIGIIIPEKFNNYNIVVSDITYEKDLKFKIDHRIAYDCNNTTDGFLNSECNNNDYYPAIHYCRNLNIGGFTDWYLPSIKELEFINLHIDIIPYSYGTYWSSTYVDKFKSFTRKLNYASTHFTDICRTHTVRPIRKIIL
jgi:hypothetical protein